MKNKGIILFILILKSSILLAQDPVLSQAYSAAQFLSPATVGSSMYDHRIQANLRSQLMNGNTMYKTTVFGWDTRINNKHQENPNNFLALGMQLMSDQLGAGLLNTTYFTINTAYHMNLDEANNSSLSVGLGGTLAQTFINKDKLRFGDQFDVLGNFDGALVSADYANLKPSSVRFAANAGMVYAFHSEESFFQLSANAFYFSRPDITYSGLNQPDGVRASVFINTERYLTQEYTFVLHASYNNRNQVQQTLIGTAVGIPFLYKNELVNRIYAGCFMRLGDAIIPSVTLMMDKYIFGISYDLYNNALTRSNVKLNGFELSLSKALGKKRKNVFRTILH